MANVVKYTLRGSYGIVNASNTFFFCSCAVALGVVVVVGDGSCSSEWKAAN